MDKFDIILTSWNRFEFLKRTIGSLVDSGAINDCERFIIVDSGSTEEGVIEFLKQIQDQYGAFLVLKPHNHGWGAATNDGLGLSRAPYLLRVDNDVEFEHDFHRTMLDIFAHQKNIGLLGVWKHIYHGLTNMTVGKDGQKRFGIQNEWFRETDDVPGVGWMMPKAAMEKCGMFPEHGVCLTKGGNGEDSAYVQKMKQAGFLTGVPVKDVAVHITGY